MTLDWLAALISPHEIAPHPNFTDDDNLAHPPAVLAAVVLGENPWGSAQLRSLIEDGPDRLPVPKYLQGALLAISFSDQREGIRQLESRLAEIRHDSSQLGETCAISIFAAAAAAELEEYSVCQRLLTYALQSINPDTSDSDQQIWRSALLAQRALRKSDAGLSPIEDALEAHDLLQRAVPERCALFATNSGTAIASADVVADMVVALQRAVWSLVPARSWDLSEADAASSRPPLESIFERLRAPRSEVLLTISRDAANSYERLAEDQFSKIIPSNTRTIGRSIPDLFASLLRYELLGHRAAREARKELAIFRVVQAEKPFTFEFVTDVLRLIRRSGDEKVLRRFVSEVRLEGPLAALADEAVSLIAVRSDSSILDIGELVVLRAAADLLTADDATAAFRAVSSRLDGGDVPASDRWRHNTTWAEAAWAAAAALANVVGSESDVAVRLAAAAVEHGSDELWDRLIARTLRILAVDWANPSEDVALAWRHATSSATSAADATRRTITELTDSDSALATVSTPPASVNDVAEILTLSMRSGNGFPVRYVEVARLRIMEQLTQIRENARRGQFSGWVYDAGEIAAMLLIDDYDDQLCISLLDYLFDSSVPRGDRSEGLERLAREAPRIPEDILDRYLPRAHALVTEIGVSSLFDNPSSSIFAAGLIFCSAYTMLPSSVTMDLLTRLSSSPDLSVRREACRCAAFAVSVESGSDLTWLLVRMSYDEDAGVRGQSVRGMLRTLAERDGNMEWVKERLLSATRQDGLSVPFEFLRELQRLGVRRDASVAYKNTVTSVLDYYQSGHISGQVRETAKKLMLIHVGVN